MYQSFEVNNFRCIRELAVADLQRVNLLAGMNNVGKTSLLEALFLHCGAYNTELSLRINAFRGIESVKLELGQWAETPWDSLFNDFDTSKKVQLVGKNETSVRRVLRLKVMRQHEELAQIGKSLQYGPNGSSRVSLSSEVAHVLELGYEAGSRQRGKYYMILDQKGIRSEPIAPPPPFPAFYLPTRTRIPLIEDADRFGNLDKIGGLDALLKILQLIEPRLRRLSIIPSGGVPIIHGDIGLSRMVPIPIMGGGTVRLTRLVLAIGNAPNGVVLVDEIENGIHHSLLTKLWSAIGVVARQFNAQVFATTHSLECIVAFHNASKDSGIYDFRLHRLDRFKESTRVVTYDQSTMEAAIETGLEVR